MKNKETYPTKPAKERAVLITVEEEGKETWPLKDRCEELKNLVESSGAVVVANESCRRKKINPKIFVGLGKAEELAEIVIREEADVVVFNDDLSPSQQKNLEEIFTIKTIDRTQLILDIFAQRATSNEGKVQVELAQLEYILPRLSRMWLHLGRQKGGIGTKGPGEQQLEVDRRGVREKIARLKRELKEIAGRRRLRREQRKKFSMMAIALVGYTNSGKSTLFNALTSAKVRSKDQLFSTLDPTIRKFTLPNNQTVLLSDTVGFLNELPHHLIESFKATLEEVVGADILFHVIDMSDPRMKEQEEAVSRVLEELGVKDKPFFTILNKSDKVQNELETAFIKNKFHNPIVISALKEEGLTELMDYLVQSMQKDMVNMEIIIPHKHYSVAKFIREKGNVLEEKYSEEGLKIIALVPEKVRQQVYKKLKKRDE